MDYLDWDSNDGEYRPKKQQRRGGGGGSLGSFSSSNLFPVDLSQLPPLETLKPEELKNFSREEILAYLQSQGINASPEDTKPALKQQLRIVISDLEKRKFGITPLPDTSYSKSTSTTSAGGALLMQDDGKMCEDCGSKKANKECNFKRCKGCCNKRDFACTVHSSKEARLAANLATEFSPRVNARIGSTSFPISSPATASKTSNIPGVFTFNSPVSARATNGQKPFGIPSTQIFSPGQLRSPNSLAGKGNQLQRTQAAPSQKSQSINRNLRFVECPRCGQFISFVGSNFFLHLNKCDPDYLTYIIANSVEFQHIVDYEDNPSESIKLSALQRFKLNLVFLQDLFSEISADDIMTHLPSKYSKHIDQLTAEKELDELLHQQKAEHHKWQLRSKLFLQHLEKLRECLSEKELDQCHTEFLTDFSTPTQLKKIEQEKTSNSPPKFLSL